MASLEIESQTFIPQVNILRSEMLLAHVSGTRTPGPKPGPWLPLPALPSTSYFLARLSNPPLEFSSPPPTPSLSTGS